MSPFDPHQSYRRLLKEIWNGDMASAEALVTPDFQMHIAGSAPDTYRGPEGLRNLVRGARAPFSSITFSIAVRPIVQEDLLAARW